MPSVEVDARTAQALQFAARIAGISPGEVVRRLVDNISLVVDTNAAAVLDVPRRVPIRVEYQGIETQAVFDPVTESVEIVSGPLAGTAHRPHPPRRSGRSARPVVPRRPRAGRR